LFARSTVVELKNGPPMRAGRVVDTC
jgi:hypothetical protein